MKPYALLLATSSLLILDQWGEASVALTPVEPDLETDDETVHIQPEQVEESATALFIDDMVQPDAPRTESFSSIRASSLSRLAEARSPVSNPSSQVLSNSAIAQPELTEAMQWTTSNEAAIADASLPVSLAASEAALNSTTSGGIAGTSDEDSTLAETSDEDIEAASEHTTEPQTDNHPSAHHFQASDLSDSVLSLPLRQTIDFEPSEKPVSLIQPIVSAQVDNFSDESSEIDTNVPSSESTSSDSPPSDLLPSEEEALERPLAQANPSESLPSEESTSEENISEENTSGLVSSEENAPEEKDSAYLRPPQIVPDESVPVFLTIMPLNGEWVHHEQGWRLGQQIVTGDHRNTTVLPNVLYHLGSRVTQSVSSNNVFNLDTSGTFVQMDTVRRQREVEIEQRLPRRMLGLHMQQTFTGACVGRLADAATDPHDQCTLIPPQVTDRESLDDFFIPTRIDQPGKAGEVISRESLEVLAAPGFQNQGVNGETIGLDLYLPNIGITDRDTGGRDTGDTNINVKQTEEFDEDYVLFVSRVKQQIQTNDSRSTIGRTIRGQGVIQDDDTFWLNALVAAATELLPTVETRLAGSPNPANTRINRNLFRAANNHWTPSDSWTLYHAGFGSTSHATETDRKEGRSPNSHYYGVWVGLSPITERHRTSDIRLDAVGPERVLADEGREGGSDANISFISDLNGEVFDSEQLDEFYAQIYLRFLERDVDLVVSDKLVENTNYRPHVSFSGNVTNANQSFRYYLGAIAADDVKAYVGGDYTRHTPRWQLNMGGVGYLNPDRDYFSQVQGSVGRRFRLDDDSNVTLFSGMRYAIGQNSDPLEDPLDNFMSLGARTNLGPVSLGVTQYLGDVLPESIDASLSTDLAFRLGPRMTLRGYYAPINNRNNYGASADFRLGKTVSSPVLSLGWSRRGHEFGEDVEGNILRQDSDTVTLQLKFGGKNRLFNF